MLDANIIRENPDMIREMIRNRLTFSFGFSSSITSSPRIWAR